MGSGASASLGVVPGMNEPAKAIGKEHVNLSWLDHGGHFALSPHGMNHHLSRTIGASSVVGFSNDLFGNGDF